VSTDAGTGVFRVADASCATRAVWDSAVMADDLPAELPALEPVPAHGLAPGRALGWTGGALRLLDQTVLPGRVEHVDVTDVDVLVDAVRRLVVRGAPALGAVGAYGVVVALRQAAREGRDGAWIEAAVRRLRDARPTAVNLAWAVDRVTPLVRAGEAAVLAEAERIDAEDGAANHAIGRLGADWLLDRVGRRPLRVLTHCNTGFLATTRWGTALGVVRELHARGVLGLVHADETRPLLQGARLTAWELAQEGIPHVVQADAAAAGAILGGLVDCAVVGADRVAANGDTANKVGTLGVALACHAAGVPFVVAAPESTLDRATATGEQIPVELRDGAEVVTLAGTRTAPPGSAGHNPAFDVTPARFVTALVTQARVYAVADGDVPGAGTS
jgi:methylthioribose-1-phosphate isomerase